MSVEEEKSAHTATLVAATDAVSRGTLPPARTAGRHTIPSMTEPTTSSTTGSSTDVTADGTIHQHVDAMRSMAEGTLLERMQIEIVEASPERLVATMPVAGNTQPYGLLHGGASVVLAESLGSIGAQIHAGPGRVAVGLDINATHHRAARTGVVTGTATLLSAGRTLVSYEVVVTDEDDRRICTSRITCLLRDAAPGA
ncbi:MAG: hotdog fold thioesterase [Dermatophilaceae bacterium]|nr:hotdog fold thioesterase [Dermatophilaceae bacterium]NUO90972.1 hotdog fold thioesterase [Dermatophilaceae bacterium]NUR81833.1 hotdog fold thioesterase [Dermatophilaceae bacterium]